MAKGVPKGVKPQVQGAERRAQLMALLSASEKPMTIQEVMEATGWGNSGAQYTATKLFESGLAKMKKEGGKNFYFIGNGDEPVADESEVGAKARKPRITSAKEVELVVAGVLVILGRNPASGRLRIVLEEM